MKTRTTTNFISALTFSSILLLVLLGTSAFDANAQQTSRITIKKDFCASIGQQNTCNGIPDSAPDNVTFTVEVGTFANGVFTTTATSPSVDVAISNTNANGSTTTDDIYTSDTYLRVCETVPDDWISIPRPDSSGGGRAAACAR